MGAECSSPARELLTLGVWLLHRTVTASATQQGIVYRSLKRCICITDVTLRTRQATGGDQAKLWQLWRTSTSRAQNTGWTSGVASRSSVANRMLTPQTQEGLPCQAKRFLLSKEGYLSYGGSRLDCSTKFRGRITVFSGFLGRCRNVSRGLGYIRQWLVFRHPLSWMFF